jgi:hypothetical protein
VKVDSKKDATGAVLDSSGVSLEVTGLGMIASVIIAFWGFVGDGTLPLTTYLVFVAFLLVSAGGLVWRIVKLAPARRTKSGENQKTGS